MRFADLHIHSCFSDGISTVEEIFSEASSVGLDCISITDHDTLDVYKDNERISGLSRQYGIEVIKGIEFSASWRKNEIHLLGYFIGNKVNEAFYEVLDNAKRTRFERVMHMLDLLSEQGIVIDKDEFKEFIGDSSASRLHVAVFMHKKCMISDVGEAFKRYIGYGKSAYSERFYYDAKDAIQVLKDAGATVLLAHPVYVRDFNDLNLFADMGLDGLEVFYPTHPDNLMIKYCNFVERHGLVATGGSDYHGSYKDNVALGDIKLPYEYVEAIKEYHCAKNTVG